MPVTTAKNHFLGKEGFIRLDCALSVLYAFKDNFGISTDVIETFKGYGSGRAPEGLCGAVFAAKHILKKIAVAKVNDFEKDFSQQAGALKCRDIRNAKKLSCVECVARSSEFLAKLEEN